MLGQEGFVDIQVLHRQGVSIKGIARELGVSRKHGAQVSACRSGTGVQGLPVTTQQTRSIQGLSATEGRRCPSGLDSGHSLRPGLPRSPDHTTAQ